jgi:hypothetical protein
MIKKILFIMLLDGSSIIYAQDSTFVKTVFAGSMLKVPKDKTWVIEKAFINAGDGYNVKINNANFKTLYNQKETLVVPSYIAEMELITDKSMMSYIVYITEKKETKK